MNWHTYICWHSLYVTLLSHSQKACCVSYLLLTKDENPSWFDWVPGWQVLPCAFLRSILVGLPDTITCGPRHAHVMPLFICHSYGQSRRLKNQVERQKKEILFIYLLILKFLFGKTSHNLQVKDYPRVAMARFTPDQALNDVRCYHVDGVKRKKDW